MEGITEKKKKTTGKYLLLHRSGAIAKLKTLSSSQPLKGITAVINLETLEQLNADQQWESIPEGCDILIEAEQEEEAYDLAMEQEDEQEEEDDVVLDMQFGARRYFNPHVIWAYCQK